MNQTGERGQIKTFGTGDLGSTSSGGQGAPQEKTGLSTGGSSQPLLEAIPLFLPTWLSPPGGRLLGLVTIPDHECLKALQSTLAHHRRYQGQSPRRKGLTILKFPLPHFLAWKSPSASDTQQGNRCSKADFQNSRQWSSIFLCPYHHD